MDRQGSHEAQPQRQHRDPFINPYEIMPPEQPPDLLEETALPLSGVLEAFNKAYTWQQQQAPVQEDGDDLDAAQHHQQHVGKRAAADDVIFAGPNHPNLATTSTAPPLTFKGTQALHTQWTRRMLHWSSTAINKRLGQLAACHNSLRHTRN